MGLSFDGQPDNVSDGEDERDKATVEQENALNALRAELQVLRSEVDSQATRRTAQDEHDRTQLRIAKWSLRVGVLTGLVVFVYTTVAYFQLLEMGIANTQTASALNDSARNSITASLETRKALAVSEGQLDAQRRQLNAMGHSLDTAERAWVLASIQGPFPKEQGGVAINVLLRNVGKSPAFVEFAADSSRELAAPKVKGYESGITIAGGEAENPNLPHIIHLSHPTPSDLLEIRRGTQVLYVWVFIQYKDAIRAGRFTQLCWRYFPEYAGRTAPCPSRFQILR